MAPSDKVSLVNARTGHEEIVAEVTKMTTAVMELADTLCHNRRLSATELREGLKETKYEAFGRWMTEGGLKRMRTYDTDADGSMDVEEVAAAVREYLFKGEYDPDAPKPRPRSAILAKRRLRPFSCGKQNVDAGIRLNANELRVGRALHRVGRERELATQEEEEDVLQEVDRALRAEKVQEEAVEAVEAARLEPAELRGFQREPLVRPNTAPTARRSSQPQSTIDKLRSRVRKDSHQ